MGSSPSWREEKRKWEKGSRKGIGRLTVSLDALAVLVLIRRKCSLRYRQEYSSGILGAPSSRVLGYSPQCRRPYLTGYLCSVPCTP